MNINRISIETNNLQIVEFNRNWHFIQTFSAKRVFYVDLV